MMLEMILNQETLDSRQGVRAGLSMLGKSGER